MLATTRTLSFAALLVGTMLATAPVRAQNPSAAKPSVEDAPRKGIGIAMQGDENGIEVVKIASGSPAEKAGVKIGDKVISIAGISVFDFNEETAKAVTDTAKTIAFVVMRGDQKMTFQIVPELISMPKDPQ